MAQLSQTQRRYRVSFRVTSAERQTLDAAAAGRRLTFSDYARSTLLGIPPRAATRRPRVDTALLARLLAKFGIIASALTDIARTARMASAELTFMPSVERELAHELRTLGHCRRQLMRALRRKAEPT
jgi:hypothetical protein